MKRIFCAILAISMLLSVCAITACKPQGNDPTPDPDPHEHNFVEGKCECGESDPDYVAPNPPPTEYTVTFVLGNGQENITVKVEEGNAVTRPETDPTRADYDFAGWFKDAEGTTPWNFTDDKITANTSIYAAWTEKGPVYEDVSYSLNISDIAAGKLTANYVSGVFGINANSEIRNRSKTWTNPDDSTDTKSFLTSVKLGDNASTISINVPGTGKLAVYVQNGSSGADYQKLKVTAPGGAVTEVEFVGNVQSSPVVKLVIDVTEGEWKLNRVSGTVDIFLLELECTVEVSEEVGCEIVSKGKVDFLVGEEFGFSGLNLNAVFENGKREPIAHEDITVDFSAVNIYKAGSYDVSVCYKSYVKTYTVTYYTPTSLTLGFDAVEKLAENSPYGNGVYYNHSVKELYVVGESFSNVGLSVVVNAVDDKGNTISVKVDNYERGFVNTSTAGAKDVLITYAFGDNDNPQTVTASFKVYCVTSTALPEGETVYKTRVDQSYTGEIGAYDGEYNVFTTIQQALDYLAHAEAGAKKVIKLAGGTYREKLEITIPNLSIIGAEDGSSVIEWDSLYGISDLSGFSHVTDSTATVAIRDGGYNCYIENVVISNYWNSLSVFDDAFGAGYSEHRALALLVQSDRFYMKGGKLLGYQDTVEFFTGRQLLEGVYIQGTTDFIFGTNNTTLFSGCTIHSITNGKTDGGYITAFKGSNKGEQDSITYGAIFYQCRFTADADVVSNGNTALGRCWAGYAAVATINCELAGHISLKGSTGASKNERYVSMNAKPTDAGVKFVEFGNTGAGALNEAVAGMRMLTAEEAALYSDFKVIFGTTNGKVSYLDAWDPYSTEVVEDDRTYYYFDQQSSPTGTSHTFDTATGSLKGTIYDFEGISINAETANVAWNSNANALNMKQGAFITFSVKAGTTVTVNAFSGYAFFTVNGVGTSASTLVVHFAEDTDVTIMSVGDLYLYSIIIDPDSEAPEAPTLESIKVEGMNTNYTVGDELSFEGAVVKAYYSDNSVVTLKDGEYTVNTDEVNKNAQGTYNVVFTCGGKSVSVSVTYEGEGADPAITEDTTLSFASENDYNAVVNNNRVTLDGNFRKNGAEYQIKGTISFMVKAGTTVTVTPYANTQYANYTIGEAGASDLAVLHEVYSFTADKDMTVVYTGLDNNYLISITITPAKEIVKESFTLTFGSAGNYKDGNDAVDLSTVQIGDNGGDNSQVKNGYITIKLAAGATLVINGYPGYTSYTLGDGTTTTAEITDATYTYVAEADVTVTITPVSGNNYFYSIAVTYAKEIVKESFTLTFGSAGNYKDGNDAVDLSTVQIGDNGGDNSQVKNGYITIKLAAGATLVVNGYPGYTSYTLGDGTTTTAEITDATYTYVAEADVTVTITPVSGNNYFYSIAVTYA